MPFELDQWQPQAMTAAVNLMGSDMVTAEEYPVLATFFWGDDAYEMHQTVHIGIDIIEGEQELMAALRVYDPAVYGRGEEKSTIVLTLPKFEETRDIKFADVISTREPGESFYSATLVDREVQRRNRNLLQKFLATLEYMGARGLLGSVQMPDANGNLVEVANWQFPEANLPDAFTGAKLWTHDDATPRADVQLARRVIRRSTHAAPTMWYGFGGSEAIEALVTSKSLRGDAESLTLERAASKLRLNRIFEYEREYKNADGTYSQTIDSKQFVVVGYRRDFFRLHCQDVYKTLSAMMAAAGEDMSALTQMRDMEKMFAVCDLVANRRDKTLDIIFTSFAMPTVQAPGCAYVMTVVG